jgi:hypothetical protein
MVSGNFTKYSKKKEFRIDLPTEDIGNRITSTEEVRAFCKTDRLSLVNLCSVPGKVKENLSDKIIILKGCGKIMNKKGKEKKLLGRVISKDHFKVERGLGTAN